MRRYSPLLFFAAQGERSLALYVSAPFPRPFATRFLLQQRLERIGCIVSFRFAGFPVGKVRLSREAVGGVSRLREAVVMPLVKGFKSIRHGGELGTKLQASACRGVQGQVGVLAAARKIPKRPDSRGGSAPSE
jgi:hypothetical protein